MQKEEERVEKALPLGLDAKMALLFIDWREFSCRDGSPKGHQAIQ